MTVTWRISTEPVAYPEALAAMEERVAEIRDGRAPELVWLLEHPPLYTAGTSAKDADLIDPDRFPVYRTGRGGQFTYHGPGQRIAYVMLDLKKRGQDVRRFVHDLEEWIIQSLSRFDIKGERRPGRIGIWVAGRDREDKIAAVGVRVRHWVTYHGIAINLDPDLTHFSGIVPCGIQESAAMPYGVTSLAKLNKSVSKAEFDAALEEAFGKIFPD
jgi:lipoyl(octanoyl) transferase